MIVTRLESIDAREVNESDFVTVGQSDVDQMAARAAELLRGMENLPLRNLAADPDRLGYEVELYWDPRVVFQGKEVGGIRVREAGRGGRGSGSPGSAH